MSSWKVVRLAEFCATGSGGTPSRSSMERYYEGGTIPWVKSGELRESIINDTEEYVTEAALRETSVKLVPAGALLLAMYGATVGRLGTLGIAATTNQAVCHIVPDPKVAETRYVYHALSAQVLTLVARGVGGAQPNISQGIIKDLVLPLPPLAEQRRIAEVLDRAEALRAKRRAAIGELDSLTQAIFFDLFGDPNMNSKGMRKVALGEVIKLKSGEFLPATAMTAGGKFPVFGGNGINGYHDQFLYEEQRIVIGRVGAYCGCVHVCPPQSWVTDNAMCVCEWKADVELEYLAFSLKLANLNQYASKSGQPLVSGSRIYPVEILVPPLALQQDFARRIAAVEKLKAAHRASLAEMDALFAALQHRAFRGEL